MLTIINSTNCLFKSPQLPNQEFINIFTVLLFATGNVLIHKTYVAAFYLKVLFKSLLYSKVKIHVKDKVNKVTLLLTSRIFYGHS